MKIYFEDGELKDEVFHDIITELEEGKRVYLVSASEGISNNMSHIDRIKKSTHDAVVYTNSVFVVHNEYCWNSKLGVPELYVRAGENGNFVRIDKLTTRKLKESHNLLKLYLAGEF